MSYDTTVRATSEVDWRMMFLKARQVVGIPDEWPFDTKDDTVIERVWSEPGGFEAFVAAYTNRYEAQPWDEEDEGPTPCYVDLYFSSDLGWDSDQIEDRHRLWVHKLGAWLNDQGVTYAVCDNRGDWHER